MVYQTPGIARSSTKKIFESQSIYNSVFRVNYEKDPDKKAFLIDLIKLYDKYNHITDKLKKEGLTPDQITIMKNGTQAIFALMGIIYRLANHDVSEEELRNDKSIVVRNRNFIYGRFISNYLNDDFDIKLTQIVKVLVIVITESYRAAYDNSVVMSLNSYFKADSYYHNRILNAFINSLSFSLGNEIRSMMDIFRRREMDCQ